MTEPPFITARQLEIIHTTSIELWGGTHGLRNEHLVHSALGAAMNDYYYADADNAAIAAAYAFHIAQAQAFLDGNKRTAIGAAMLFLERSGIETQTAWENALYDSLHAVAEKRLNKMELAALMRRLMSDS